MVAAADDTGRMDVVGTGLAYLGGEPSWLGAAARSGLVAIDDGQLQFCHPLARSATYHLASSDQRRAAHYALSTVDVPGVEEATRAWHRAAAAVAPDEKVAHDLELAAEAAMQRGAPSVAGRAFQRAASLTPAPAERAARLLRAVEAWWLGNDRDAAATAADEALAIADDPLVRADVVMFRGLAETWGGNPQGAVRMMTAEAESVVEVDAARATDLLTKAVAACLAGGEMGEARRLGERAMELGASVGGTSLVEGQTALASACAFSGEGERARELAEPLIVLAHGLADVSATGDLLQVAALLALSTEQLDRAEDLLDKVMTIGRTKDRLGLVTYALFLLSEIQSRDGRWADAYAQATSCRQLGADAGHLFAELATAIVAARIDAAQGREADARATLDKVMEVSRERGLGSILLLAESAHGFLELGLGRVREALAHLESAAAIANAHDVIEPAATKYHGDLIEALVRLGRTDDALRRVAVLQLQAESTGQNAARAIAARGRGLLAEGEEDVRAAFEEALGWHELCPQPFERARTELCYAERLRRSRQRMAPRDLLRSALTTFERLGAARWAERARNELAAAGEAIPRASAPPALDQLTPQELQVALLVARGATNREVAAEVFLSAKTVEKHLGNVYRKLELRSRTQLAGLVAAAQ